MVTKKAYLTKLYNLLSLYLQAYDIILDIYIYNNLELFTEYKEVNNLKFKVNIDNIIIYIKEFKIIVI